VKRTDSGRLEPAAKLNFEGAAPRLEIGLCQWPWNHLGCTINYTRGWLWKGWKKITIFQYSASTCAETFPLTLCILKSKDLGNPEVTMATVPASDSRKDISHGRELISFEEAMEKLSRDDRFRATVYAMNTLLVQKGVYSPEEFEFQFRQFAQKQLK
jgi:hypothetical protein